MTQRKTTNNPIPSNALADLSDNAIILDEWTNGSDDYTVDRFGNKFKTRKKILNELQTTVEQIQSGSFLPLSGGTVIGDVNVRGDLKQNGKDVFTVDGGEITGNVNVDGKLQQNGIDVLTVGDGGLFSESPLLVPSSNLAAANVIEKNQTFSLSGEYIGTPDDTASWSGFLDVKRGIDSCILTITRNENKYEKIGKKEGGAWGWNPWVEYITTSNTAHYAGKSVITETYLSSDGLSWYRKWSDGFIEQGGSITASTTDVELTVNFVTPFTNKDSIKVFKQIGYKLSAPNTAGVAWQHLMIWGVTTSSFKNRTILIALGGDGGWIASGY